MHRGNLALNSLYASLLFVILFVPLDLMTLSMHTCKYLFLAFNLWYKGLKPLYSNTDVNEVLC